jgi:pimeloyl-ACP methyl ester carboxylesterase
MGTTPLILFSGMGADRRIFEPQIAFFPQLIVPAWIKPEAHESLPHYAQRFAHQIDPGCPCYVGGASFGGFVALEAARHLQTRACFLIGSARCPSELPLRIRALRKLKHLLPRVPFEWIAPLLGVTVRLSGDRMRPLTHRVMKIVAEADASYIRWACGALLSWDPCATPPTFPIYQIHGRCDCVLPARRIHPDTLVTSGGHLLTLTRPEQVNHFLEEKLHALSDAGDASERDEPMA